jgi:hypothetical protein
MEMFKHVRDSGCSRSVFDKLKAARANEAQSQGEERMEA